MTVWMQEEPETGGTIIRAEMTPDEAAWVVVGLKARLDLLPENEATKDTREHYYGILEAFRKGGVV